MKAKRSLKILSIEIRHTPQFRIKEKSIRSVIIKLGSGRRISFHYNPAQVTDPTPFLGHQYSMYVNCGLGFYTVPMVSLPLPLCDAYAHLLELI